MPIFSWWPTRLATKGLHWSRPNSPQSTVLCRDSRMVTRSQHTHHLGPRSFPGMVAHHLKQGQLLRERRTLYKLFYGRSYNSCRLELLDKHISRDPRYDWQSNRDCVEMA